MNLSERSSPWYFIGMLLPFANMLIPDHAFSLRAQGSYVLLSSLFFQSWILSGRSRFQSYYLAPGFLLLGLAAFCGPAARVLPALADQGIPEILCGTAMVLAGLLDHRQLVRTLEQPLTSQMERRS